MDPALRRVLLVRRFMFVLSLVGLFISTYLLITYVSEGPIVCGISQGCEIVRASKWATSFSMPRPLLGVAFYAALAVLLVYRTVMPHLHARWAYRLGMLAVTVGFVESAFLTLVQWIDIKAFCVWCISSAVTATALFVLAWWDRAVAPDEHAHAKELKFQFYAMLAAAVLGTLGILFMLGGRTDGEKPILREPTVSEEQIETATALLWPEGLTTAGSSTSTVTVTEFIDLECPACATFHPEMAEVRDRYGDRIRFAYRHFPLPTHAHAMLAAQAAVCAEEEGMLFDFIDLAIVRQDAFERDRLVAMAAELRLDLNRFIPCLDGGESHERVQRDIADGKALGVFATPTVFVNTAMIDGLPSSEQLSEIIDRFLSE